MTDKPDGGEAFPWLQTADCTNGGCGMSLRDYFAGQALVGLFSNDGLAKQAIKDSVEFGYEPDEYMAVICYGQADALIAERDK